MVIVKYLFIMQTIVQAVILIGQKTLLVQKNIKNALIKFDNNSILYWDDIDNMAFSLYYKYRKEKRNTKCVGGVDKKRKNAL